MKLLYSINIIFILFLYVVNLTAQDIFLEKQKGFKNKRLSVLDSLKIKEADFKHIALELRVYYTAWNKEPMNSKFVQIVKDKNGLWSGKSYLYFYYNRDHYNFKDIVIENLSLEHWDEAWQTIVQENYLNLPTELDIKQEKKPLVAVADGYNYTIEILTKKKKRRITYDNPEVVYESCSEYGLNCYEYKHFLQLIQLMKGELELDF